MEFVSLRLTSLVGELLTINCLFEILTKIEYRDAA